MSTPSERFFKLLDQQPDQAIGQFAHLVTKRLRKLNTHTSKLSDRQVYFCLWAAIKTLEGKNPDTTPMDKFPAFPKEDEDK
jgi:hypothetical protein